MIAAMLYLRYQREHSKIKIANSANFIGKKFDFLPMTPLNTSGLPSLSGRKKVVVLVSPTCPHCKRVLKLMSIAPEVTESKIDIIPIYKSEAGSQRLRAVLKEENISFPAYMMPINSVMRSVKAVPVFLYLNEDNRIDNSIIGGVIDKGELKELLESLVNKTWRKGQKSAQRSACSS